MKRIAQTQVTNNDDAVEQSVMLSPRTLLTGPRQIVRLERQYRSLAEDFQNSLENLNRTKDSYVSALHAFEQAEAYIRQLAPKVRTAQMYLNSARSNPQYLAQAEGYVQAVLGGGGASTPAPAEGKPTGSSNTSMVKIAHGAADAAQYAAEQRAAQEAAANAGTSVGNAMTPGTTTAQTPEQQQQQAMNVQRINALQSELSTFVGEMQRRYNIHKQRAAAMEGQYNMSKAAYAKVRAQFFQLQTEISSLTANLSGWNERLSEYYAPGGGEA